MSDILIVLCRDCKGWLMAMPLPVPVSKFAELASIHPKANVKQWTSGKDDDFAPCKCEWRQNDNLRNEG